MAGETRSQRPGHPDQLLRDDPSRADLRGAGAVVARHDRSCLTDRASAAGGVPADTNAMVHRGPALRPAWALACASARQLHALVRRRRRAGDARSTQLAQPPALLPLAPAGDGYASSCCDGSSTHRGGRDLCLPGLGGAPDLLGDLRRQCPCFGARSVGGLLRLLDSLLLGKRCCQGPRLAPCSLGGGLHAVSSLRGRLLDPRHCHPLPVGTTNSTLATIQSTSGRERAAFGRGQRT